MEQLVIHISEEYVFLVKLTLFDANLKLIEPISATSNQVKFKLPKGLYTIRTEMNGEVKDEVLWFDKKTAVHISPNKQSNKSKSKIITPPLQFSSALLNNNYSSSPIYHTHLAVQWSEKDTYKTNYKKHQSSSSSLFIFLRFPSKETYDDFVKKSSIPFWSGFELINENGVIIFSSESGEGLFIDKEMGCLALNLRLQNGIYYLHCKGLDARYVPLYVFKDWHTQFFMTIGERNHYGTIRIFLSKERKFNPDEQSHKYIDTLLDKLQNRDFELDRALINLVAHGKFESPMLALICSYIYLNGTNVQDDQLIRLIIGKLQEVILKNNQDAPDLRALSILAKKHFSDIELKNLKVYGTPMFRIGFDAILMASMEHKRLITQKSVNDFVVENRYFDSPFNTFKPFDFPKKQKSTRREMVLENADMPEKIAKLKSTSESSREQNSIATKSKVSQAKSATQVNVILDKQTINYIKKQSKSSKQNNWLRASIAGLVSENENISMHKISEELCIPASTVDRVFKEWQKEIG